MPVIKVRENEPFDVALRRFKRSCEKAGVLAEVRRREFYEVVPSQYDATSRAFPPATLQIGRAHV